MDHKWRIHRLLNDRFRKGCHVDTSELVDEQCKDMMAEKSGTYFSPNNPGSKHDYENVETLSNEHDGAKIYVFGLVSGSEDFYSLFTKVSRESKGFWEWEILKDPVKKKAIPLKDISDKTMNFS